MKIVKTTTTTYEISSIQPFGKYGEFVEARIKAFVGDGKMKELRKCFNCGHEFTNDEDINAAFMIRHKNVFLCNACAESLKAEAN
mgnify:CR=1 FL=1